MKFITNIFITTGIMIGIPLLFYIGFHGIGSQNTLNIDDVNSGYAVSLEDGTECDLEKFLLGVLPAEIDLESSYEAVKAQAVIARTSILRQMDGKKKINVTKLEESYISEEKLREQLGEDGYQKGIEVLTKAVLETKGIAMQSDGAYIAPLYHEVSVGTTVSAKELYGKEVTYLQEADSSEDVESKDYMKVESWEYGDVIKLIQKEHSDTKVTEEMLQEQIAILEKTDSGYVKSLKVGEETFTGEEWKKIFDLNSTNFYIEDYDNKMRMITLGKGHGLGLSQYGANWMAENGNSYKKILKHYYHGIKFSVAYE